MINDHSDFFARLSLSDRSGHAFSLLQYEVKYAKETRKTDNIRQTWHKLDKKLIRKRIIITAIIYLGKEVP